ncbi:MAG: hypothetical protein J6T60_14970 [Bacteroidales bacterium]|nr:hypothetical protein [Bacteroidales bacterium]
MKKQFLRILPAVAAVLLATACSKDSDDVATPANVATPENVATPTEEVAAPAEEVAKKADVFTLTVSYNTSLSKVSLVDALGSEGPKNLKFDVGDKLNIIVDGEDIPSEGLTADDIEGNSATFHFTNPYLEGKTKDDIESGYMGGDLMFGSKFSSLTDAFNAAWRDLNTTTWTLEDNEACYIYMDSETAKTVYIEYEEDFGPNDMELTKGDVCALIVADTYKVTVDGVDKTSFLKPGKIFYVK